MGVKVLKDVQINEKMLFHQLYACPCARTHTRACSGNLKAETSILGKSHDQAAHAKVSTLQTKNVSENSLNHITVLNRKSRANLR